MSIRTLPAFGSDQELYDALKNRNEKAYGRLYADLFASFKRWVITNNGSEMDAEDAFQKGLMGFLINLETGKYQLQEGTRISTVVFEYCKRVWFTELKSARLQKRSAMPETIDEVDTTDVANDLERLEIVEAVRQSLDKLKGECKKILEWFYVDDLPLREIAELLGMKESSVKSRRYQCAEKLKTFYLETSNRLGL